VKSNSKQRELEKEDVVVELLDLHNVIKESKTFELIDVKSYNSQFSIVNYNLQGLRCTWLKIQAMG